MMDDIECEPFLKVPRCSHFHHWVVAGDSVGCGSLWLKMVEPEVIQHLKDLGHTVDLTDSSPGQWQKRGLRTLRASQGQSERFWALTSRQASPIRNRLLPETKIMICNIAANWRLLCPMSLAPKLLTFHFLDWAANTLHFQFHVLVS